jgi:hypothetical protein
MSVVVNLYKFLRLKFLREFNRVMKIASPDR